MIPVYQPALIGNEKKYVDDCLDTGWISSKGKYNNLFEEKFSQYIGTNYATTVCNGTIALHLALMALNLGEGDEVIVPTFTYIASVNAIHYVGAKPVFCDSKMDTWQMDPYDIEKRITPKTKAIMAVHLYGHPCDMDAICQIAKKHNLFLIEDCAEAIGSEYKGKKVGSFGDISAFSFFGNKTITCGEGGMVLTNNRELYDRSVHLKGQGLAPNREYWHDIIGYNFRMTNVAAAIGLAQLEQVDFFIEKKMHIAKVYEERLKDIPVQFHGSVGDVKHTYWMCSIKCTDQDTRDALREYLKEKSIETRPTFYPVHLMTMYFDKKNVYKNAEAIGFSGINLPSFPMLTEEQIIFICNAIKEFFTCRN